MVPDLTSTTFEVLVVGVSISLFILILLSTRSRLKKLRCAKSRKVVNYAAISEFRACLDAMETMEEKVNSDKLLMKETEAIILVLPDLES